jgi:hypothetical protein
METVLNEEAIEPEWNDDMTKEAIIKWFMERMENVPDGARMDVKIGLSYEKDGEWIDA